ncbi:hypothetical protein DB347_17810 [Opitutaceae bacterium EW11]|nr:hypothetical protein DB347_17810 [Opitutaceae bacterium EW11]
MYSLAYNHYEVDSQRTQFRSDCITQFTTEGFEANDARDRVTSELLAGRPAKELFQVLLRNVKRLRDRHYWEFHTLRDSIETLFEGRDVPELGELLAKLEAKWKS